MKVLWRSLARACVQTRTVRRRRAARKLVQIKLERLEGFLEHEQHDAIKRKFALARKGHGRGAMARQKAGLGEPFGRLRAEWQGADGLDDANCREIGVHPHAEMKSR